MESVIIPNEALLSSIFLQSPNVVAITNADFNDLKFEYVNPAFLKMTGYSLDEVIGSNPKMLQGPLTKRDMTKKLKEACLKGESFRGDNINYKKDGSTYVVGWTVTPIKDDSGKVINFLSIQKDITKIKELEEENIKAQKLQALNHISSGLTHELNTALTNARGSLEMMGYDVDSIKDETAKEYLKEDMDSLTKGVEYISFLTNSLHYLTNTNFALDEEQNISELILDSLNGYEKLKKITACTINGISIFDENLKIEDINIKANKKALKHLFMVIIDNALDELVKNPIEQNLLDIKIQKENEKVLIDITDNAGGISDDVLSNIFNPLHRKKDLGGLGIGLYVAKNIVKGHNGSLEVESNEPYSRFKIVL